MPGRRAVHHNSVDYRRGAVRGAPRLELHVARPPSIDAMLRPLRGLICLGLTLAACGCAVPRAGLFVGRPRSDALLDRDPVVALFAQDLAHRVAWPAVENGYEVNNVEYFSDVTFDEEGFYDELGGGFLRSRFSERSGAIIR